MMIIIIEILNFRKQIKPTNLEKKQKKEDVLENLYDLFEDTERVPRGRECFW